jgi:hypothetical protein
MDLRLRWSPIFLCVNHFSQLNQINMQPLCFSHSTKGLNGYLQRCIITMRRNLWDKLVCFLNLLNVWVLWWVVCGLLILKLESVICHRWALLVLVEKCKRLLKVGFKQAKYIISQGLWGRQYNGAIFCFMFCWRFFFYSKYFYFSFLIFPLCKYVIIVSWNLW